MKTKNKKKEPVVPPLPPLKEHTLFEEDWNEQESLSKHDYVIDSNEESY